MIAVTGQLFIDDDVAIRHV